jgi:PAS domain S-box-containing protein
MVDARLLAVEDDSLLAKKLQGLLEALGYAVVATDKKGRITFLNQATEGLSGWKQAEAMGKDLGKVIHILDHGKGKEIENLADQALQEGFVMRLSDRIALISRDGKSIPIEGSISSLQNARGNDIGVVLLFRQLTQATGAVKPMTLSEAITAADKIPTDNLKKDQPDPFLALEDLKQSNLELILALDTTLEGWAKTLELRANESEGHSRRVTDTTLRLAHQLSVREEDMVHIRRGALLHDIGELGIPDSILHSAGSLTAEEWKIMVHHPIHAYNLLSPILYLRPALDIPYCHHEKWDGSGYPRGLKKDQIPLAARIFAVVDVWDALLSDRPYRSAWPPRKAYAFIRDQSGKHFDPNVVEAFLQIISEENPELAGPTNA